MDGGDGIDAVLYQNTSDEYSLKVEKNVVTVSNGGDKDTFTNIERIQFLDSNLAVDLDGNAGDAARFLGILLGKESVSNQNFAGIVIDFLDRGVSYSELMQIGLDAVLGPGASGASVVDLIYNNLVGSSAPESLLVEYGSLIDSGALTAVDLAISAGNHPINESNIDLVGLSSTGLEYMLI